MNNKKGFTLIELLAVIVILAVIALIVTPVVTGIIKSAKEQADRRSAEGYVKAAENFFAATLLDQTKKDKLGTNIFDELEVSSKVATKGNVVVDTNGKVLVSIVINNKCYSKEYNQNLSEMVVSNDITNCGNSEATLVGTTIEKTVLTAFPQLELGTSGCKTSTTTNYSYMNGCYLKGAQTTNYLWYSGFLWRIMGINADKTVKLIMEEDATSIPHNINNNINFDGSYIDNWLNNYFYKGLRGNDIITLNNFCQGLASDDYSISRTDCTNGILVNKKVGLITMDEYNLANESNSYLKSFQDFWTMTPYDASNVWQGRSDGYVDYSRVVNAEGVRAVINVKAISIITGGNGILSSLWNNEASPYILNESKIINTIVGLPLNANSTQGEYVKFANKIYRVVSKDNEGNTKLILDGYYQEIPGTNYMISHESNNTFSVSSGIGLKLNGDVLNWLIPETNTIDRNKLVADYVWYQNNFTFGDSYMVSLNEANPTRSIHAAVGLIRLGEMLSSQSHTILTKNGTQISSTNNAENYWTLTPYATSSNIWDISSDGDAYYQSEVVNYSNSLRPVIVVNSSVKIISGTGIPSSPYEI